MIQSGLICALVWILMQGTDRLLGWQTLQRPIVTATVTGFLLGDIRTGMIMAASLEAIFMYYHCRLIKLNMEVLTMLYPFMTLNDGTEIVHSETIETAGKEKVEVRIEKPVYGGFHSATCWLPEYKWENIDGFSPEDIQYFQELLESVAHIILQLAREGGIEGGLDDASGF